MKRVMYVLFIVSLMLSSFSASVFAKNEKVDVCHVKGNGDVIVINVSENAVPAHMGHGDLGVVGVDVDENCEPLDPDTDGDGYTDSHDNCPFDVNADQNDSYGTLDGDACEDSDGDGTPDVEEPHICISRNNVEILRNGTALCGTYALDKNNSAPGGNNSATATGYGAKAYAVFGDNNTATATGDGAWSIAHRGNNNTATATGDAFATANNGDNNTATATGDGAFAYAQNGDNNTATATATGGGAWAFASSGNNNTATATDCSAPATGGGAIYTCP